MANYGQVKVILEIEGVPPKGYLFKFKLAR